MSFPLVECIPNFSEGRRLEVVDQIAAAILSVPNVRILDRHSDQDHNRTVITLLGSPDDVKEAVYLSIVKASELIDMDVHQGEHPRIGATDVVPFVPIREISIQECVELARQLGQRVGNELGIPVYLYEDAATVPERINLENIRKGQFEGLKSEIGKVPERKPDFGPEKMGKAGATVIGAREALIAFNVYLSTDDVSIAKAIAKTIRFSSGGFRYVKAMGVLVEGRAQVSMNLTNYRKTPISLVFESIRREAQRYGTSIHHSELVGLVPQEALVGAAVWYTQLDQFQPDQVLESRLSQPDGDLSQGSYKFLDELASDQPTPGGGSAAAFTAAEAAALVSMVARLTIGKKRYADVEDDMKHVLQTSENLRQKLTSAIEADSMAFNDLMISFKLPKETEEEQQQREKAIYLASLKAAEVPLNTAELAIEILRLAIEASEKGNPNAITDAGSAGALSRAAISSAGANVRINLSNYSSDEKAINLLNKIGSLESQAENSYSELKTIILNRGKIKFS